MNAERRAPCQAEGDHHLRVGRADRHPLAHPRGTISWEEFLEAYKAYSKRYGKDQSAETLAARGGFGYIEIIQFLGHESTTWKPLEDEHDNR